MKRRLLVHTSLVLAAVLTSGCASLEHLVTAPGVSLRNVQVERLDLTEQSFLLSFDVTNPNPFPLPISMISYAIELDGHRFANGETPCSFTVPASGDGEFAISVNINLLKTAPELLYIVRDGVYRDIPYGLEGQLGVDIPYAKPVRFQNDGLIRLQAAKL
ncbi:MAG: LEA type 2 family protein [Gammaproteobacteria bacterium]|nr:LEA type 2 family protein [Gammaproteobacteria bacterium]